MIETILGAVAFVAICVPYWKWESRRRKRELAELRFRRNGLRDVLRTLKVPVLPTELVYGGFGGERERLIHEIRQLEEHLGRYEP